MDPNAALRELRAAIADFNTPDRGEEGNADAADRVVTYAEALDGWLSAGGFLPDAWEGPRLP